MTEGNFSEASLFSSSGLKDMLGTQPGYSTEASTGSSSDRVQEVAALPSPAAPTSPSASSVLSVSRLSHNPGSGSLNGAGSCGGGTTDEAAMIEAAMLAAEDAEDAEAMHAARFEAQHEMNKVDDSRPATSSSSFSSSGTAGAGAGAGSGGDADDDASTVAGTSASSSNAESAALTMPLITSIGWLRNTVT